MKYGHEQSRSAIVAAKPTNKAERSAAEPVERRAEAEGKASQQSTHRAQYRGRVSNALARLRRVVAVGYPRWEPYAGKLHVRICAGGAQQWASLPRPARIHNDVVGCWY